LENTRPASFPGCCLHGFEDDFEAKAFQSPDVMAFDMDDIELIEVVCTKFFAGGLVFQKAVNDDEHGVGDCNDGFLVSLRLASLWYRALR
jgi:hypothetical protein